MSSKSKENLPKTKVHDVRERLNLALQVVTHQEGLPARKADFLRAIGRETGSSFSIWSNAGEIPESAIAVLSSKYFFRRQYLKEGILPAIDEERKEEVERATQKSAVEAESEKNKRIEALELAMFYAKQNLTLELRNTIYFLQSLKNAPSNNNLVAEPDSGYGEITLSKIDAFIKEQEAKVRKLNEL